jgi:hypothetical protein
MLVPICAVPVNRRRNCSAFSKSGITTAENATVGGWCRCKDEGGTRNVSGDASNCDFAYINAKGACEDTCENMGGVDLFECCYCSGDSGFCSC